MKTIELNNAKLVLYSSIKELPQSRYRTMQHYLLHDSGIGNTMADIDRHLNNSIVFLSNSKTAECKTELANLRYSFYSMINGIDYKTKAFACLVKEIDGVLYDDITADGLNTAVEAITALDLSNDELENIWMDVKKNWMLN